MRGLHDMTRVPLLGEVAPNLTDIFIRGTSHPCTIQKRRGRKRKRREKKRKRKNNRKKRKTMERRELARTMTTVKMKTRTRPVTMHRRRPHLPYYLLIQYPTARKMWSTTAIINDLKTRRRNYGSMSFRVHSLSVTFTSLVAHLLHHSQQLHFSTRIPNMALLQPISILKHLQNLGGVLLRQRLHQATSTHLHKCRTYHYTLLLTIFTL